MLPSISRLASQQDRLARSADKNYLQLMGKLCSLHQDKRAYAATLLGHIRARRFTHMLALADSLSSQKYDDATEHFVANQFALLIKKYPWTAKESEMDPEATAVCTFVRTERKCELVNRRFALYDSLRSPHEELLARMRHYIAYVIGFEPDMERIYGECALTGGANIGINSSKASTARKLSTRKWTTTPGAALHAQQALLRIPVVRELLSDHVGPYYCYDPAENYRQFWDRAEVMNHNNLSFVPKTAKTHRVIAVEPLLNGFVQKGVDQNLRAKLKRAGIDLKDGQEVNRRLAREGSLDDSEEGFVTIDLSSASDSIATGVVKSLLPPAWFELLSSLRASAYSYGGVVKPYHKFSTMGNGFSFPLETLLFAACCNAAGCGVAGQDYVLYGDDIIVRKKYAALVITNLTICGFKVNTDKTFLQGPFRESCGSDWFGGVDVRPCTLDYKLDCVESYYKLLNLTKRNSKTSEFFAPVRSFLLNCLDPSWRLVRPFTGEPDSGIDCEVDEFLFHSVLRSPFKTGMWEWLELKHAGKPDLGAHEHAYRRGSVDMYAVLSGGVSKHYRPGYTLRFTADTTMAVQSHAGATCQWLPEPSSFWMTTRCPLHLALALSAR